jgi:hypothetical protein
MSFNASCAEPDSSTVRPARTPVAVGFLRWLTPRLTIPAGVVVHFDPPSERQRIRGKIDFVIEPLAASTNTHR